MNVLPGQGRQGSALQRYQQPITKALMQPNNGGQVTSKVVCQSGLNATSAPLTKSRANFVGGDKKLGGCRKEKVAGAEREGNLPINSY